MIDALEDLCVEKNISPDVLIKAVEDALKAAYKKNFNQDEDSFEVELDSDNGTFHVYVLKIPVDTVEDPETEISIVDVEKNNYRIDEEDGLARIEVTPKNFGRIAAQTAKQIVVQKLREAERGVIYDEFSNRDNDLIKGRVLRVEDGNLIVEVGKTEAILVPSEQVAGEDFQPGDSLRAYIAEVKKGGKGPQVYLSRTHPAFLRRLVEMQVPEIQEGIIEIRGLAREAGARSKLAVISKDANVDAVGSCVGQRGVRIQPVLEELGEEKLDIVEWSAKPGVYVANALSPSKIISVAISDDDKSCRVVVPDNQLSLAIGKEGQNARLAAKLTGWKIDIKSFKQAQDAPLPADMHEVDISDAMAVVKPRQKKGKR
ncbi:MAG: transcription termination/antitermination protein NusA [Selenomonadaceae bacterium]|nr:transcription termination/antitermination protein NusA [Selenomonadaceae bacterium]